jgi:hypothetical protein
MKRTTPKTLLALAALALPLTASAQFTDQWRFGGQLYAYFPTVSGSSNFQASSSTPSVNVGIDDLLELEFAFMGSLEVRKGRWGAFTDYMYLNVGSSRSGSSDFTIGGTPISGTASADFDYDLKGYAWTIAGTYGLTSAPTGHVDLLAGARRLDLEQKIRWQIGGNVAGIPVAGRSGEALSDRGNWDGIIGAKGRFRFGEQNRWFLPWYVDIGTGDSDFTWQAMGGLGYSWGWGDAVLAWRHIDYDFGNGRPFNDLTLTGPSVSLVFHW